MTLESIGLPFFPLRRLTLFFPSPLLIRITIFHVPSLIPFFFSLFAPCCLASHFPSFISPSPCLIPFSSNLYANNPIPYFVLTFLPSSIFTFILLSHLSVFLPIPSVPPFSFISSCLFSSLLLLFQSSFLHSPRARQRTRPASPSCLPACLPARPYPSPPPAPGSGVLR